MQHNPTVSREEWRAARTALLAKEKAHTRARDALAAERRALPWVRVDKAYRFQTEAGERSLAALFDGRSQLIVQHFMFGPDWEAGCTGCSFEADHVDAAWQHLQHHDVGFVAVARAPIGKLAAYRRRMGWRFPLVSSAGSDFNFDFHVSFTPAEIEAGRAEYNFETTDPGIEELPGASVFLRDPDGTVFHTYSSYGRGGEEVIGTYMLLDITPRGRNESGPMDWVRRHDEYGD
ncbi:MAG: thioredoxin family protein [Sneathiellaceae bacterium]